MAESAQHPRSGGPLRGLGARDYRGGMRSSRRTRFRRFLRHALGSACELEYHLLLVRDLGLITDQTYRPLATEVVEVKRMPAGLIRRLDVDAEH